ncbi:MAG TPA: hypoxanthine phosphoribosyltransferase [bacterium]
MNVLIKEEDVIKKVKDIGALINSDYRGKNPVLIGVLKGAFVFLADLLRELEIPHELDFLAISSYSGKTSRGIVKISADLSINIEDRDVILVEDIVDTGCTLHYILENLKTRQPRSLAVCALLNKKENRRTEIPLTYVGFTIPSVFVVGYGLDYENQYRNLRYIGVYDG